MVEEVGQLVKKPISTSCPILPLQRQSEKSDRKYNKYGSMDQKDLMVDYARRRRSKARTLSPPSRAAEGSGMVLT
jgi:hypothetical protein